MMILRDFLEDFGQAPIAHGTAEILAPNADIEALKLEAFESGYKAGWDDAIKAQSDDQTRISSGFGQHLQDLSFTYHEAYGHIMNAMAPLLDEMVNSVLPEIARQTFGSHVVEHLETMSREIGKLEVIVAVSSANRDAVAQLVENDFGFPVQVVEDDSLADEQADIRFGEAEQQIDLGGLLTSVSEAVEGFAHDNRRKLANG